MQPEQEQEILSLRDRQLTPKQIARKLGLKASEVSTFLNRDFDQSKVHLGESTSEINLKFGRNGKPYYVEGPYDNTKKIINTLKKSVGDGNFDYLYGIG